MGAPRCPRDHLSAGLRALVAAPEHPVKWRQRPVPRLAPRLASCMHTGLSLCNIPALQHVDYRVHASSQSTRIPEYPKSLSSPATSFSSVATNLELLSET